MLRTLTTGVALAAALAAPAQGEAAPPPLKLRSTPPGDDTRGAEEALRVVRVAPQRAAAARAELERRGVAVLRYLPDGGLLVAAPRTTVAGLPFVAAIEAWTPRQAISPELTRLGLKDAARLRGDVRIVLGLAPGSDLEAVAGRLAASGARVAWLDRRPPIGELGLVVQAERLEAVRATIGGLGGLVWADLQPRLRLRNAASAWVCQSGVAGDEPLYDRGLRGERQVVGIMDTGLDIDSCFFRDDAAELPALNDDVGTKVDPDHRKVLAADFYWSGDWPDPGVGDWDDNGHGTHVAGSVAGDQGADALHQGNDGMAPAARLIIQDGGATVDDCADLPGLGCPVRNLGPVFEQAWAQGARIHSDSWGDEENLRPFNRYTERTADVDRFVWEHPDTLIVFAAGNAGPSFDTVGSPATGKNVLAVGAALHGDSAPPCVANFSSRGWTADGRIKPDVVAPGSSVWSAATDRFIDTDNCDERALTGTSMACPTVAGLAALVRQYFEDGYYPGGKPRPARGFSPSAALLKAVLIASAVDLTSLGCSVDPIPSRAQGWGFVMLDRALPFPGDPERLVVVDDQFGFAPGDRPTLLNLRLDEAGPLKLVLVWSDPPSSSVAAFNLVNDLDLGLTGPDGRFLGNVFAGGESIGGGEPDRLNTVEVVSLADASPGRWTVRVEPHLVVEGPQPWALVAVGAVSRESPREAPADARRAP